MVLSRNTVSEREREREPDRQTRQTDKQRKEKL